MRHDEDRSYNKFLLLAIQLDQLRAFLMGTPSTLVDGKIEKTAISIRVLTNYVKSLRYLQGIDRPGREKFRHPGMDEEGPDRQIEERLAIYHL